MLRRLEISLLISFVAGGICLAQPFTRRTEGIPFTMFNDSIAQPFAGGINTPDNQFVDIDGDGDVDLFVLDNDLHVDFYRNEGTRFHPNFKLKPHEISLPPFQYWFLFTDLNGDGKIDLCTDDSSTGIRYFENTGTVQVPQFVLHTPTFLDTAGVPVLGSLIGTPSFVDIDGDGLLDLLSVNVSGSFNYYRNVGTPNSPKFAFVTGSFQNIVIIGDTCPSTKFEKSEKHGGGSLQFVDIDANGTKDLFYGDLFSHGLFYMQNTGTATQPHIQCVTNRFPDSLLVTLGFNQASFVDIDGDHDVDLFVGVLNNMERHGFWEYENIGDSAHPLFSFRTKDYLSMIDAGSNAHPVFVDIDNDNDLDLITGNLDGQLWLFRNNGTRFAPSFVLEDTLFAGISGNYTYAPAFVDIDHDGDKDLFIGRFDGRIKFFRNTGTAALPQFTAASSAVDTIHVSQDAAPVFVDIDGDGDEDLFVGKGNGQISFYRNDGDSINFVPILVTTNYDSIAVGEDAQPTFVYNSTHHLYDLYVGNAEGTISYYENTGDSTNANFVLRTTHYANTDPMREAVPAFADIDGDGDLDLFVGNSKGGIHYYRNDLLTEVHDISTVPPMFRLEQNYPNPFNPVTTIRYQLPGKGRVSLRVYDLLGRLVRVLVDEVQTPGAQLIEFDARNLSSGMYYYQLIAQGFISTKKMLFIK